MPILKPEGQFITFSISNKSLFFGDDSLITYFLVRGFRKKTLYRMMIQVILTLTFLSLITIFIILSSLKAGVI